MSDVDHDQLIRVEADVAYIRRKLDTQCDWQKASDERQRQTEKRITKLEIWRGGLTGAVALLCAVAGWGWLQLPK